MSRPLRLLFPGAVYHVTARGNERARIYRDSDDFEQFLSVLGRAIERYGLVCHGYCLMNNHYHLLIETPRANLPIGMRHINGCYTQAFNRRWRRSGHLFQGRYSAVLVEKEAHLLAVVRYLARNPIRAKLAARPEDWRWSSYPALIGKAARYPWLTVGWVLAQFGGPTAAARAQLRSYVEDDATAEPLSTRSIYLAGDDFIEEKTSDVAPHPEIPRDHWQPLRPSLEHIFSNEAEPIGVAYRDHGYTLREIADHTGRHYTTISRRLRKHEQQSQIHQCKT